MEIKSNNENVSMKDYLDGRIDDIRDRFADFDKYVNKIFELNAKAIDQYSKTTDEWKVLHNDLQRKLQDDRNMFVTKEDADKRQRFMMQRTTVIILIVSIIITIIFAVIQLVLKKS